MKKTLFLIVGIFTGSVYAQDQQFIIEGKINNLNKPARAILNCTYDNLQKSDTVILQDGKFRFTGTVPRLLPATILLDHSGKDMESTATPADQLGIVLSNGSIFINSKDSIVNARVSGSPETSARIKMDKLVKRYEDSVIALFDVYGKGPWNQKVAEESIRRIISHRNAALRGFIRENPDSYTCLTAIDLISRPTPEFGVLKAMHDLLSERVRNTRGGKSLGAYINSLTNTSVGSMASNFSLPDSTGKSWQLSDFRGKFVLLDFWASWCGPCRADNPTLVKAFANFKNKNFTILSVALEKKEDKAKWQKAITEDKLSWLQLSDFTFWNTEVVALYGIQGIPQNYLIDPQGVIIGKNLHGQALLDKLEELL